MADAPSTSSGVTSSSPSFVEPPLFSVVPLNTCPHLDQVRDVPSSGIDARVKCTTCDNVGENWICLTCYSVNCGRHVNGHAVQHFLGSNHAMSLSLADLSVWCYECEAYIHNDILTPAKRAAHISKFGCDIGE
uniref:UBP-type domain-containing protein n=1 Tax=Steinernema glaseri TaxID=37863 RepID=A0A1I7Z025_9BILA